MQLLPLVHCAESLAALYMGSCQLTVWSTCRMELNGQNFMEFFQRVEVANFEIASDAFSSFKVSSHTIKLAGWLAAASRDSAVHR